MVDYGSMMCLNGIYVDNVCVLSVTVCVLSVNVCGNHAVCNGFKKMKFVKQTNT